MWGRCGGGEVHCRTARGSACEITPMGDGKVPAMKLIVSLMYRESRDRMAAVNSQAQVLECLASIRI
jgi:hypothetical protein